MAASSGIVPPRSIAQRYSDRVAGGQIGDDPAQRAVIAKLDRVLSELSARRLAHKSSALGWLFASHREAKAPVRGLYIHGGVGRGKTMLMDLFFDAAPGRKRRVHFNAFMAEVHDRIQAQRQARRDGRSRDDDPIPPVAAAIAAEAALICFDEFSVTDIADAMVLSRLFSALFGHGVVLVATSNVEPDDLYRDGLNRQLFLPFIDLLKRHAELVPLASPTDYRLRKLGNLDSYLTPLNEETKRRFEASWQALAAGRRPQPDVLTVKGRNVAVPLAVGEAARFSFAELCEQPLAARDYLAIAARYPILFVEAIPVIGAAQRNEAKRFILLIDTLYDKGARLIASAAAAPEALYAGTGGTESFEFARTASRLVEMQGAEWLDAWVRRRTPAAVCA